MVRFVRFSFPFFNVYCDETWGLGSGPAKELVKQLGVGGVYTRHVRRVHDLLAEKYKKRMMMWADIALKHPDHLAEIPKDTIMLTWGYEPFAQLRVSGLSPSQGGLRVLCLSGHQRLVADAARLRPRGSQHPQFRPRRPEARRLRHAQHRVERRRRDAQCANWHGYAWGAECAWNGAATESADFNQRLGAVLFGEKGDHFGRAVGFLRKIPRLAWMPDAYGSGALYSSRFWEADFPMKRGPGTVRAEAKQLLDLVRPGIEQLQACRREATVNAYQLDALLFAARRVESLAQRWPICWRLPGCTGQRVKAHWRKRGRRCSRPRRLLCGIAKHVRSSAGNLRCSTWPRTSLTP